MLICMCIVTIFYTSISEVKIYADNDISSENLLINNDMINQSNESIISSYKQAELNLKSNSNSNPVVLKSNENDNNETEIIEKIIKSSGGSSLSSSSYVITTTNETNTTRNCTRDNPCEGDFQFSISITDYYDGKTIIIEGDHINTDFIQETLDLVHTTFTYLPRGCYPIRREGGDNTSN